MKYHIVSTSNSGHGAIFTNKTDAMDYMKQRPGSSYTVSDALPDRIPSKKGGAEQKKSKAAVTGTGKVIIYTDGSALNNPGPGGYGIVMQLNNEIVEFSQGYRHTTNNRMEMMAVITALEELGQSQNSVTIFSDSQYTINGITKGWAKNWRAKGWKKGDGKPALNPDLWERMLNLVDNFPNLTFQWVKGHAGDPLNERADELANTAAQKGGPLEDSWYKQRQN